MARSVLVVDDDALFRRLAGRLVTAWGHVVLGEAGTVEQALARAAELEPDVVLADIGLPDGDGFGLTRALVARPHPPLVILISSDSDAANGQAALRVGARGFVSKDELLSGRLRALIDAG